MNMTAASLTPDSQSVEVLRAQAVNLHMQGATIPAARLYEFIIDRFPGDFESLVMSGVLAAQTNRLQRAADLLRRAVEVNPASPEAHNNLGIVLTDLTHYASALSCFDMALSLSPRYAEAFANRAVVLGHLGHVDEALAGYDRAIELQPGAAIAHLNRGSLLLRCGRPNDALASFDRAIALQPGRSEAFASRGAALLELGRPHDALASYDRAIALGPAHAPHHNDRGIALQDLELCEQALESYDRAIALDPLHAGAHHNRATVLEQLWRFDEAIAGYDRSIELRPESADPAFAKGICLLRLEQFEDAWHWYEARTRGLRSVRTRGVNLSAQRWNGRDDIGGRSLLITWEQGLGDTLQFCRYALLAAQRGARVALEVQPALQRLLQTLHPSIEIVTDLDAASRFDYHCPLLSLPAAFGTTASNIPHTVPYLAAETDRVSHWRKRLGEGGFKIGICWQGTAGKADIGRSVPLEWFEILATIPGVRLVSLQRNHGTQQLRDRATRVPAEQFGEELDAGGDAFLDSAAIMQHLDLVISSDTAIAHLAGALARPAWIVLKRVPDWRWGLTGPSTPWYPTLRLFRQARRGDWEGVFRNLREALLERLHPA